MTTDNRDTLHEWLGLLDEVSTYLRTASPTDAAREAMQRTHATVSAHVVSEVRQRINDARDNPDPHPFGPDAPELIELVNSTAAVLSVPDLHPEPVRAELQTRHDTATAALVRLVRASLA